MRRFYFVLGAIGCLIAVLATGTTLLSGQAAQATPNAPAGTPYSSFISGGECSTYSYTTQTGAVIVPGTLDIGNNCDDCTTTITLPFSYQLYDQTFALVTVSSNGNLQFVGNGAQSAHTCLPDPNFTYTIFPHFQDMVTDCFECGIFTSVSGTAPNRIFNIEWRAAVFKGAPLNFEARLYEGQTRFDVIYGSVPETGVSSVVGVQKNASGQPFTQFECNTLGTLKDGLQIAFSCAPPTAGVLVGHVLWEGRGSQPGPGQIMPVTLTLRSAITEVNYPMQLTDPSGFFTTTADPLPAGTYSWRVKGPTYLSESGSVSLQGGVTHLEMGSQRASDSNGDNVVDVSDFNLLKNSFGQAGDP